MNTGAYQIKIAPVSKVVTHKMPGQMCLSTLVWLESVRLFLRMRLPLKMEERGSYSPDVGSPQGNHVSF